MIPSEEDLEQYLYNIFTKYLRDNLMRGLI